MDNNKHKLVLSSLNGDSVQVCPDLYLFKTSKSTNRHTQSYGLVRNDRLVLIDTVHEINKEAVEELKKKFPLSALLLTDSSLLSQSWGSIEELQNWLNCPVYAYPSTIIKEEVNNIVTAANFLGAYGLNVMRIPGVSPSSIIIYDSIGKYLFTGNSFVGSDYRSATNLFFHPAMNEEKWSLFYNAWRDIRFSEVKAIFPLQGKFKTNIPSWTVEKDRIMIQDNSTD